MASTSRALAQLANCQWKQDVYLSFRGEDTHLGITSMLYDELENRRIKTFKDDHLDFEEGMAISPRLLTAIEESRFAIVVLSANYASSTWCLDELTKIVESMEEEDRFLPLFYHVEPTDVRYQKKSFEVAFTKHEKNSMQIKGKVEQWKAALKAVANHSGWDSKNYESDRELVKGIVEFMCSKVHPIEFDSIGCEAFKATRQAMGEVMRAMKDDNVRVIGVHGMGGVGKTTMVKHVGAQAQKDGIFEHVIMANVSQTPDLIKIQGTFADLLRLKLEGSADKRAVALKNRIMRGNKILLILDDIWSTVDLLSIGIPSLDKLHECNSKILFTTRILNVCHNMESQANISLQVLSEEDAWNLFVKKTRKYFHESTVVYNVARTVARECAGLPLALISVARTLGDKDLDDWKEAARRLTVAQPANPEDDRDVFNCIKLSYDFLRPDDASIAKSFFLLCCLFPKNYDIVVEDLLTYAIGKGLFQDVGLTINEARAKAHSVVKYLKDSSLLLDSEHCGFVRMHSVIRNVAISISLLEDGPRFLVKAECDLKDWPMVNVREGYSAISLMRNHIQAFPRKLVCSKLQILLLQSNAISVIPKTFFQSPNELRVLDISKTSILSLSPSFSLLTDLRALYLDDCMRICDLSILGKLKKLEILSMRNSCVTKMPKEIGELTNLKMLDVTNACFDTVPSNVISKLRGLEEMYFECGFREWGGSKIKGGLFCCGTGKNAGFGELLALSRLESLKVCIYDVECLPKLVSCNPNWINFNICISQIEYKIENIVVQFFVWAQIFRSDPQHPFRRLSLDTTMNTLPKWFISVVTEKAEILEYRDCRGLKNILVEYDDGRLHGLKYLAIVWCGELDELMNSRTGVPNNPVFENLEELHLYGLDNLKELCAGNLPPGSLSHLKILSVENCKNLVNVLLPSSLLHMLQNLEILNCECSIGMEYVFGSEGVEPEQVVWTKLTEITLCNLPSLISIWNGPVPVQIFQNLKYLRMSFCQKMNYLLTSSVAKCLLQLELLWVENCSELDRIIAPSEERDVNKVVIPELKDIYLSSLPNLRGLYCSTAGTASIECPSLEHLYVDECPLFSTPSAPNFRSRNHVRVHDLQHMRSLRTRLWESNYNKLAEISLSVTP